MHSTSENIEIQKQIEQIEKEQGFKNFVCEDNKQYLRVFQNGGEVLLFIKDLHDCRVSIDSRYSPFSFTRKGNYFVGKSKDFYFGPSENNYNIISNCIAFLFNNSSTKLTLTFDAKKNVSSVSKCVKTFYERPEENDYKGLLNSLLVSKSNFSFYNLNSQKQLYTETVNKIDLYNNCVQKILCDDGKRLIQINFIKTTKEADCLLRFYHIPKHVFFFEIESKQDSNNISVDVEYISKNRNIESVYNEYGNVITSNIYGKIKLWSYLLFKQINQIIFNDSFAVLLTFELLLLACFLFLLAICLILKRFIGKEQLRFKRSSSSFVNDNNSKFNNNLQMFLFLMNFPIFLMFSMYVNYTWEGIDFIGKIIGNITLSSKDSVLLDCGLFYITSGRIIIFVSFIISLLPNIIIDKENSLYSNLRRSVLFSIFFALLFGKVGAPIMHNCFFSMFILNKTFMYILFSLIFNIPLKII